MHQRSERKSALLALLLLVPASSIGQAMALLVAPGGLGQSIFVLCSIWLHGFPLAWFFWGDRGKLHLSPPKRRDLLLGVLLGVLMFGIILAVYGLNASRWIDVANVQHRAQTTMGKLTPASLLAGFSFIILINTLLEEYVWRWFVFRKCEVLVPRVAALALSAFCFTLHHMIDLVAYFSGWRVVGLGTLAVFCAGMIWSRCYQLYRSIWVSSISHAFASLAIAFISWQILFA